MASIAGSSFATLSTHWREAPIRQMRRRKVEAVVMKRSMMHSPDSAAAVDCATAVRGVDVDARCTLAYGHRTVWAQVLVSQFVPAGSVQAVWARIAVFQTCVIEPSA